MISNKFVTTLMGFTGLLAACSAPPPTPAPSGEGRSEALSDSAYNALIDDPSTGQRDWISTNPEETGIAYWHVGWVSRRGRSGQPIEYVLATGYDNATKTQSVEVVIPQTQNGIAYQFRSLGGAQLDEDKLTPDIETITEALADVFASGAANGSEERGSRCVGGRSSYRRPGDLRRLRRCRIGGDSYGGSYDDGVGYPDGLGDEDVAEGRRTVDPIVIFLSIAVGVAEDLSARSRCTSDVNALDDDYRTYPSSTDGWDDDCHNRGSAWRPRTRTGSRSGEILGSCSGTVGDICFNSEGDKGRCGADGKCRRL